MTRRTRHVILFIVALAITPARGAAQASDEPPHLASQRAGLRMYVALSVGRPMLAGSADAIWSVQGGYGTAPGFAFGAGYDWDRLGLVVGLEAAAANPSHAEGEGAALGLFAGLSWRPVATVFSMRPRVGIGYVRQTIGGVTFAPGEFPEGAVHGSSGGVSPENVSTMANGVRLSVGGERAIGNGTWAAVIEATGDLLSFSQAEIEGYGYSTTDPGLSFWPKLVLGMQFRP